MFCAAGWIVGVAETDTSTGCLVTRAHPAINKHIITHNILVSIFKPFNGDNGNVEVPKLIQETTQCRLVSERADQESFSIGLRDECDFTKPFGEIVIKGFLYPYLIAI